MTATGHLQDANAQRLDRMLEYLHEDPDNATLRADAVAAAFSLGKLGVAQGLLDHYAGVTPPSPELQNLQGLVALASHRFEDAAMAFSQLRTGGFNDPALRFNEAWALAMMNRHAEAEALLDDDSIAASERGPAFKVQMLHHLGDLEAALAVGERLASRYPANQALMGALANLAMDAEHPLAARTYAERAPDNAGGLAVLGMFALDEQDTAHAATLFERALTLQDSNPRAWIGKGLALLSAGQAEAAATAIDKGAGLFATHSGSWIASGWAHFLSNQFDKARVSFERAVDVDPNFSEGHGGLAVLDIKAGDLASAERRCEIALRLDRQSLGGTLSRVLIAQAQGDAETAGRIVEIALNMPLGPDGRTLLQMLARVSTPGIRN